MTRRNIYYLMLLGFLVLIAQACLHLYGFAPKNIDQLKESFIIQNLAFEIKNTEQKKYLLKARKAYKDDRDILYIDGFQILYGKDPVVITSKKGVFDSDGKHVELAGEAQVSFKNYTLNLNKGYVDLKENKFYSNENSVLTGSNIRASSERLIVNYDTQTLELNENVKVLLSL